MKTADSLTSLVGRTPLLSLDRYARCVGLTTVPIAKLEMFNPGSSSKDRAALAMLRAALADGRLRPGGTFVEPTSGNTGIALSWAAAALGLKAIIVMPDTMSSERRDLIRAYGAELCLSPGEQSMSGSVKMAQDIVRERPGAILLDQFSNEANPDIHARTTSHEIWEGTQGEVDIVVAGVGTGGTISGIGRTLKALKPDIRIVAVEPAASPLLTRGHCGSHKIQGLGADFIPHNYHPECVDEVIDIEDDDAIGCARRLASTEGLLAGISSGAALRAAERLALRPENRRKRIVVIFPDTGERYLSTCEFDTENYPL